MAVAVEKRNGVAQTFSLTRIHSELIERLAALKFDGNRSQALRHLIDLHAGKEVERAEQAVSTPPAPYEIVRWKSPKLSNELIAYVAGLVRAGNMPEVACNMAGITPRQRSSWMKTGRNDRRDGRESLAADFVGAIAKAEGECEADDIRRLREHGETTWTALAWRLERQYPDRYAQRKRIDGKVQHSLVPTIDYERLSLAETRQLVELLRKASPEADDPSMNRTIRPAIETVPEDIVEVVDGEWAPLNEGTRSLPEAPALEAPALDADPKKPGS